METHYDKLKVARGAPAEVIKAAYRALSQRYHPDRNPIPEAGRVMHELNEAYAVLGDPQRRDAYDRELDAREHEQPGRPFAIAYAAQASWRRDGAAGSAMGGFASMYSYRAPIAPALGVSVARCFARLFDVGWETGAVGVAIALLPGKHRDAFSDWMSEPGNPLLFALLCVPVAMMLDASVYRVAGNTPGKALLGLKVTTLAGGRLSWSAYWRRNLAVWVRGLGCGIPFVNLVTMWRRGREVSAGADAAYDVKTGHQAIAAAIGVERKAAFGVLCVALLLAAPLLRTVTAQPAIDAPLPPPKVAPPARPHHADASVRPSRSLSWTNPQTGDTATVDGVWQLSSTSAAGLATVYTFSTPDGRTAVMFAGHDVPDVSMGEYVLEYLRSTSSTMDLTTPASVEHSGVSDTWTANGHLTDRPAVAVRVELRHVGQSYWRMVVLRSPQVPAADPAAERLVQQLWATVPGV